MPERSKPAPIPSMAEIRAAIAALVREQTGSSREWRSRMEKTEQLWMTRMEKTEQLWMARMEKTERLWMARMEKTGHLIESIGKDDGKAHTEDDDWRERLAKTERLIASISEEVGGMGNADGDIFENEVAEVVRETRRIGNVRIDAITEDIRSLKGNQFDLVGINGNTIVLVEAKQTLRKGDVIRFAKDRMPAFKADFATGINGKKVKGALIYRRLGGKKSTDKDAIAREALDLGFMLVRTVGKNNLHHIKTLAEVSKPARELKRAAK